MTIAHPSEAVRARFSIYVLPSRVVDPARAVIEAEAALAIGLGGVWISERFALKEPAVICGMLTQAASGLRIGGTFYAHLRHPIITASTDNRFQRVLARAGAQFFAGYGVPPLNFERLADSISIYRQLWSGETVDYDGVLGSFEGLRLADYHDGPLPPIIFAATGPKALAFAGTHCDGVLLHPMLTKEAVAASARIVRDAAREAGRDPARVRVISNVIVAADLPKDREEAIVGGRAVTYLQSSTIGPLLVALNGWDPAALDELRRHPSIAARTKGIVSEKMTHDQLVEASLSLPGEWLETGAIAGTTDDCANRLCEFFDAGADEILLHGSAPAELGGLVAALGARLGP